jgi:chemotaxis protein MotA
MKAATAIGIAAGVGALLLASMMEGTQPMAFFNISALIIVLGGTGAATLASVGMDTMKRVPSLYKLAFGPPEWDVRERVELIVGIAEQARREGLLALDAKLGEIDDEFTRKGLQLVVDGTDPELVREILDAEIDGMAARHAAGATAFEKAGGYGPTMGIIGTVMGLVHVLQNLSSPATLGPAISTAFIATLLGVGSANVFFLPVASRLRALSAAEVELRTLTLDGILSVQAGDNPRVVGDKLSSFVAPAERPGDRDDDAPAARPAVAAEAPPAADEPEAEAA